jgi:hypothetical protein
MANAVANAIAQSVMVVSLRDDRTVSTKFFLSAIEAAKLSHLENLDVSAIVFHRMSFGLVLVRLCYVA